MNTLQYTYFDKNTNQMEMRDFRVNHMPCNSFFLEYLIEFDGLYRDALFCTAHPSWTKNTIFNHINCNLWGDIEAFFNASIKDIISDDHWKLQLVSKLKTDYLIQVMENISNQPLSLLSDIKYFTETILPQFMRIYLIAYKVPRYGHGISITEMEARKTALKIANRKNIANRISEDELKHILKID